MALIGTKVPVFSAKAYVNGEIKNISNEDALGKWAIYHFYPSDFSALCLNELEELQEKYGELVALQAEVYSVSTATHLVHKGWADASDIAGKLTFPMLADPTQGMCKAFQVLNEEAGTAFRGTFIADPEGSIAAYEVHAASIGRSAEELLRKLKAAQSATQKNDGSAV